MVSWCTPTWPKPAAQLRPKALAGQPGMEAHFQDVADSTLDTVLAAREAVK